MLIAFVKIISRTIFEKDLHNMPQIRVPEEQAAYCPEYRFDHVAPECGISEAHMVNGVVRKKRAEIFERVACSFIAHGYLRFF